MPTTVGIAVLLLAVLPFVLLSRFAHPSTDDFCIANSIQGRGFWEMQKDWYVSWTGRFMAMTMMYVSPLNSGSLATYKLLAPITLVALFVALFWLGREVIDRGIRSRTIAVFALAVLAAFVYRMASPAEGLYWYTGTIVFTWPAIFAITCVASGVRSQRSATAWVAWSWAALSGLGAVAAAGSNEVMIVLLSITLTTLASEARRARSARWHLWLVPLILALVAASIDVLAPGNAKRAAATSGFSHVGATLLGSAAFSAASLVEWVASAPILIGLVAIVIAGAMAPRIPPDSRWRRTHWALPASLLSGGVWVCFFFTHWASGFVFRPGPPGRVINLVLLFSLVSLIVTAFMAGLQVLALHAPFASWVAKASRWSILVFALTLFGDGNVRDAYTDLVTGRASSYDRELTARYDILRSVSARVAGVSVPALSRPPRTILFRDITSDSADWRNVCYARYWRVPSVKIAP